MKEFFKVHQGYVLIDDHNVYITKTGNWSETKKLKQFQGKKPNYKKWFMTAIMFTALSIFGWFLTEEGALKEVLESLSFGSAVSVILFLVGLVSGEDRATYYIPKEKVLKVEADKDSVVLHFESVDLKIVEEHIGGLSSERIDLLKSTAAVNE